MSTVFVLDKYLTDFLTFIWKMMD